MHAIEVRSLSKHYGAVKAVEDVSFTVQKGEVFGFLGPNGAGKTTTIKVLTTLLEPTGGSAKVLGYEVATQGHEIRKRIGVVQQQESYEMFLSVEDSLDLYGMLWGVPPTERKQRMESLLERLDLKEFRKTKPQELSIGQRRRVQVAREFMHDMELLFLDEPTIGLDPLARRAALDLFKEKVKEGLTIFFTTHIMEEAEYLCDRIAVIDHGRIVEIDTPDTLKRRFGKIKAIELALHNGVPPSFFHQLEQLDGVQQILRTNLDGSLKVITDDPLALMPKIFKLVDEQDLSLASIYVAEPTLEEAFINMLQQTPERQSGHICKPSSVPACDGSPGADCEP